MSLTNDKVTLDLEEFLRLTAIESEYDARHITLNIYNHTVNGYGDVFKYYTFDSNTRVPESVNKELSQIIEIIKNNTIENRKAVQDLERIQSKIKKIPKWFIRLIKIVA